MNKRGVMGGSTTEEMLSAWRASQPEQKSKAERQAVLREKIARLRELGDGETADALEAALDASAE
jgi:hypothetical protein